MIMKYSNISHYKALQNVPKLGFLARKNKPSGNPGFGFDRSTKTRHWQLPILSATGNK
jgi:hypothetical protein